MVSLAEMRAWLKIPDGITTDDGLLQDLEERVVAFVERQTGYSYTEAGDFVELVTGNGTGVLYLGMTPSADPTVVTEMAEIGDAGTAITAAQSDGWVRYGSLLRRKAGGVWTLGAFYSVTYDAGYSSGAEPGEVRQAVLELVALSYNERGSEGLKSETISGYSLTRADSEQLSYIVQKVLANVRPVLA